MPKTQQLMSLQLPGDASTKCLTAQPRWRGSSELRTESLVIDIGVGVAPQALFLGCGAP